MSKESIRFWSPASYGQSGGRHLLFQFPGPVWSGFAIVHHRRGATRPWSKSASGLVAKAMWVVKRDASSCSSVRPSAEIPFAHSDSAPRTRRAPGRCATAPQSAHLAGVACNCSARSALHTDEPRPSSVTKQAGSPIAGCCASPTDYPGGRARGAPARRRTSLPGSAPGCAGGPVPGGFRNSRTGPAGIPRFDGKTQRLLNLRGTTAKTMEKSACGSIREANSFRRPPRARAKPLCLLASRQ